MGPELAVRCLGAEFLRRSGLDTSASPEASPIGGSDDPVCQGPVPVPASSSPFASFVCDAGVLERCLRFLRRSSEAGAAAANAFEAGLGHSIEWIRTRAVASEVCGAWDRANTQYIRETLDTGIELSARSGDRCLLTGPVHKAFFAALGMKQAGHTEYLAARVGGAPVMLFDSPMLRVVPLTRHIPLCRVTDGLSADVLERGARVSAAFVAETRDPGVSGPIRLALCCVDPHCGEWGGISTADLSVREWLYRLAAAGVPLEGPFPSDVLFQPDRISQYDAILCWYHDQAMIPVKLLALDEAVNVTLGLRIKRVSPAHGVAYDLAGTGTARAGSFCRALALAGRL